MFSACSDVLQQSDEIADGRNIVLRQESHDVDVCFRYRLLRFYGRRLGKLDRVAVAVIEYGHRFFQIFGRRSGIVDHRRRYSRVSHQRLYDLGVLLGFKQRIGERMAQAIEGYSRIAQTILLHKPLEHRFGATVRA